MKRFQFPLRPVAILRGHREARAREAFAGAVQGYGRAMARLDETRQRVQRFEADLRAHRHGVFSAGEETHTLHGYRREAEQEIADERGAVAARGRMEECRAEYLEAHRQLEILRRLEAKARSAHRRKVLREEQMEFDEFAARCAALNRKERASC